MAFKILEHTADVGVIATGKTYGQALEEAALGMFSFMGKGKAHEKEKLEISVERERKDELVVFLLSEILAQCEAESFAPAKMRVKEYDGTRISVEVSGERKTPGNIIKAVTFHMLEVNEGKEVWKIQVLFDI